MIVFWNFLATVTTDILLKACFLEHPQAEVKHAVKHLIWSFLRKNLKCLLDI